MYGAGGTPYMTPAEFRRYVATMNGYGNGNGQSMGSNMQGNYQQMQFLKGRPVSSMEEAKASMIDMDGSLFVFTDVANEMIYTKQILMDGSADFSCYKKVEMPKQQQNQPQNLSSDFVPRKDFEDSINILVNKIKELEGKLYEQCNVVYDDATIQRKPTFPAGGTDGTGKKPGGVTTDSPKPV